MQRKSFCVWFFIEKISTTTKKEVEEKSERDEEKNEGSATAKVKEVCMSTFWPTDDRTMGNLNVRWTDMPSKNTNSNFDYEPA